MAALTIAACMIFIFLVLCAIGNQRENMFDDMPGRRAMCIDGEYIYTAEGSKGLCVYRIDKVGWTEITEDYQGEPAYDVCTDGKYIYVANGRQGVCQYVFDGECLTYIDWLTPGPMITGVTMKDGYIVGTTRDGGQYKYTANAEGLTQLLSLPVPLPICTGGGR